MSTTYSANIRIEVPVRDIEVTDRVGGVVESISPDVELDHEPGQLADEAHKLERFSEHLHEQVALDAIRHKLAKRRDDDDFSFALKKQTVLKSVANFSVGNPDKLGDIEVHMTVRNPSVDEVIDYIAPPTGEGRPVGSDDR